MSHRSKDRRSPSSPAGRGGGISPKYSSYYKERFGSQSPEEYKSLRITNIDPKISGEDLRETLDKFFRRYGEMHTKIVRQMDVYERIAYINFEHPDDARDAKHDSIPKIYSVLGKRVTVDPANVVRDQGGRFVQKMAPPPMPPPPPPGYFRGRSRTPPPPSFGQGYHMDSSRSYRRTDSYDRYPPPPTAKEYDMRDSGNGRPRRSMGGEDYRQGGGGGPPGSPIQPRPTWHYDEADTDDDHNASRTLFVGNLELDITTEELRRHFSQYGVVEEIDIKTPHEAVTGYAFVRFSDLISARGARKHCSGEYLRDNRCKIGWGKPIITRRLWVGGVAPDTSLAWLEKEFDRFGAIEKIDYVRGDNHAYVLFSNTEAAVEAWKKMKGLRIKNGVVDNVLQVDFADCSMYDVSARNGATPVAPPVDGRREEYRRRSSPDKSKRRRTPSSSPEFRERASKTAKSKRESDSGKAPPTTRRGRTPEPSRGAEVGKSTELNALTLDDLYLMHSPLWTGVLVLKRSAYPIQLYKLAGDDDLVDALLRNDTGESVQLNVSQRLKLDQPRTSDILKVSASSMEHNSYLLAVPNPNLASSDDVKIADLQSRPLKLLVKYFKEKDAAGVVNVATSKSASGVVYAFPKCQYADEFVGTLCPKLAVWRACFEDVLLMVLQRATP